MVTQAVLPYLPHDCSGHMVNISSVASSMGFTTHTLYRGTKAALESMTQTLAVSWRRGPRLVLWREICSLLREKFWK
ncbi:SDR family oxidoreductase [Aspergillus ruber CBS 135680]|uniref:Uncharacterized protein n=1 Tax=Aspergillus ruber (strain CBS 135680) TaxID=1388766 RepID=A0A017RZT5_ASPRC|nr:uncharacterized protein EURHEDRAFT_417532 [Aspergillus ruber CBS 135680]EYE90303.1 hypothetical protein EURHEDRAFT_417532 [Aspergillus ruber CBS 135680]